MLQSLALNVFFLLNNLCISFVFLVFVLFSFCFSNNFYCCFPLHLHQYTINPSPILFHLQLLGSFLRPLDIAVVQSVLEDVKQLHGEALAAFDAAIVADQEIGQLTRDLRQVTTAHEVNRPEV